MFGCCISQHEGYFLVEDYCIYAAFQELACTVHQSGVLCLINKFKKCCALFRYLTHLVTFNPMTRTASS